MKLPPLPGLLWIILLWALFYAAQGVHAEPPRVMPPAPVPDTRVVIDISGSMKKTDPKNLRVPATKLLLNLAQDKSRFGIWLFGKQVNNIVPLSEVSSAWKKKTVSAVNAINSRGLFTNIGAALEAAAKGVTKPDPAWNRTIVLLSDGKVDISKDPKVNAKEQQRILTKVVPRLKAAGFHIRTVALSDQADKDFLKALALKTGGSFIVAKTADDLMHAFVDTSDKVNSPEQVPLINNTFSIDPSVKEFTVLVFHKKTGMKKTELVDPNGHKYSLQQGNPNVSWFADPSYDLVTVYNPDAGKWKVIADMNPDNRVTVVSDLQVDMTGLPDNVLEGEKVTMKMSLTDHGRIITNPNFLGLMDITFSQDTPTGEHYQGKLSQGHDGKSYVPDDGIYTAKLGRTLLKGEQTFTVVVDGKTFKRKKVKKVMVYRDVMSVKTEYKDDNGKVLQYLDAQAHPGMVNPEKLKLVAEIQDPKGEKSLENGVQQADGSWRIDVPPGPTLGDYQVLLKVSGTSINGEPFELVQGPYSVDYTPVGMDSGSSAAAKPAQSAEQKKAGAEPTSPPSPGAKSAEEKAAKEKPATPPVTFNDSAMKVPSLDVQELPPDDMPPVAPEKAQNPAPQTAESKPAPATASAKPGKAKGSSYSWLMLASIFILGNVAIVGVGVFFYIRFLRKTDKEQTRVVDEITELKQRQLQERGDLEPLSAPPEPSTETVADGAPLSEPPDASLEEDVTVMRPLETEPELDFPSELNTAPETPTVVEDELPPAASPEPEPEPDQEAAYVNAAAPLDLEDDEMIEVDDDFDEELVDEGVDNLDELDMMLNEQEEVSSDTEINQTIDQMLEQPTVFPEKKPKSDEEKDKDDNPHFADDEFMLDNPDSKKG